MGLEPRSFVLFTLLEGTSISSFHQTYAKTFSRYLVDTNVGTNSLSPKCGVTPEIIEPWCILVSTYSSSFSKASKKSSLVIKIQNIFLLMSVFILCLRASSRIFELT